LNDCFKIFAFGGVGGDLTAKLFPFCRDDLLSDYPSIIDSVVSFSSCMNPFNFPSLNDHVQCFTSFR